MVPLNRNIDLKRKEKKTLLVTDLNPIFHFSVKKEQIIEYTHLMGDSFNRVTTFLQLFWSVSKCDTTSWSLKIWNSFITFTIFKIKLIIHLLKETNYSPPPHLIALEISMQLGWHLSILKIQVFEKINRIMIPIFLSNQYTSFTPHKL